MVFLRFHPQQAYNFNKKSDLFTSFRADGFLSFENKALVLVRH